MPDILEVQPRDIREELIDLLWEHRHWPLTRREDYERLWDWRYGCLGDGPPRAWVARDPANGRMVGHISLFYRHFRLGATPLVGGAPGDCLVHREHRKLGLGSNLMRVPMDSAARGEFDFVLFFPYERVTRMTVDIGCTLLGRYRDFIDLVRASPAIKRRLPALASVGLVADALVWTRRAALRGLWRRARRLFQAEPLDAAELSQLDRTAWRYTPERLVPVNSTTYVAKRYLEDPFTARSLWGIRSKATRRLEGYVVLRRGPNSVWVSDCEVNRAALDEATAFFLVAEELSPKIEAFRVPLLPGALAGQLRRTAYLPRSAPSIFATAWWDPAHPSAGALARTENWHLYEGAADA